jgi:hypothetical protein
VPEILKQAYAMGPGTQKEIIIDHGDGANIGFRVDGDGKLYLSGKLCTWSEATHPELPAEIPLPRPDPRGPHR